MSKRPAKFSQKKKSSKNISTPPDPARQQTPELLFAGGALPMQQARDKDENLSEGYLHSLIDQLHHLVSQLKTERVFLETALKQMPCGVVIADAPSGRLRAPNNMVDQILRKPFYPAKSISDYGHWKGFHVDGRPYEHHEWPMARAIKYGEEVRGEEIRILRGDGTFGYIEVNASPILDEKHRIVAGIVSFNDITEQKAARKGILENVERLRLAQVATGVGFWENDLSTGKVYWSEETFRLMGRDPKTFKPSREGFLECVHPEDRARVSAHVEQISNYRKEGRISFRLLWPDGTVHWVEERAQPFFFNGDPVRIFGVTVDVTARKQLEEKLAELGTAEPRTQGTHATELRRTPRRKAKAAG